VQNDSFQSYTSVKPGPGVEACEDAEGLKFLQQNTRGEWLWPLPAMSLQQLNTGQFPTPFRHWL